MVPGITLIYAALLGLLLVALSFNVARQRGPKRVGLGDGDDAGLRQAMRAQGNFTEYVPLALILVAGVELLGVAAWYVHALGAGLLVARLAHAQGLYQTAGSSPGRLVGILLTWLIIVAAAATILLLGLG